MRFYCIKEKGTNRTLSSPRSGAKATEVELSETRPPRLFSKEKGARRSLAIWETGVLYAPMDRPAGWSPNKLAGVLTEPAPWGYDVDEMPDRKGSCEVVLVDVTFVADTDNGLY